MAAETATTVVRLVLLVEVAAASTPPTLAAATAPSMKTKHGVHTFLHHTTYLKNDEWRLGVSGVRGEGVLHNLTSKYTVHAAISSNCVNTSTSKAWILFRALVDILNKKELFLFQMYFEIY